VAQFKFTVLLMPNGPDKITGLPFDPATCESDKSIEDLDIQVNFKLDNSRIQINYACILYALGRVYGCLQMVTGKDSIIAILSSHFKNTNFSLECIKKLI